MRIVFHLSLCVVIASLSPVSADEPAPGQQVSQEFSANDAGEKLGYLLYLPRDYQSSGKFPLLLFLHGSGERGNDLALVKKHGPPKLIGAGKDFPMIVVSPQCPTGQGWNPNVLLALLDNLETRFSIDPQRIHVTGLSMGGSGTWRLIAAAPDRFASAIPICGHGDPWMVDAASRLPVWVVVGDLDRVAPNALGMVDSLRARGADVKWTLMPETGHDSWTATYSNPAVYDWILSQRNTSR